MPMRTKSCGCLVHEKSGEFHKNRFFVIKKCKYHTKSKPKSKRSKTLRSKNHL